MPYLPTDVEWTRVTEPASLTGDYLFPLYHHISSYHFLFLCDHFQPPAMSFNLARSFEDHRRPSRPSQIITGGRTASHGIARLCHSSLPNMGGLVLYMVTCIYTLRADQGSLESISKDFPCVRYVAL